jgi:hypothetical protein
MRIQPLRDNPCYWEYQNRPALLLGGSAEDNLFQIPDLKDHLNELVDCGGNYIRCTLSSRDPGNVWPFERDPATGLYDLESPSAQYWQRFETCLQLCRELGIILQIEVWDRFDFARDPWEENPFNPRNNRNYTAVESGLAETYRKHPSSRENPFFRTVPSLEDNGQVLRYQRIHVDRLIQVVGDAPNVLFCMDNETNEAPEWSSWWADYLKENLPGPVFATEMWDAHDILDPMHQRTWKHPGRFAYCDISQVNHQHSAVHGNQILQFREEILATGHRRPLNMVKIYGADTGNYGTARDGQERFWRAVFCGVAAVRFHRPPSGLGLGSTARAHIRSLRLFTDALGIFTCSPAPERLPGNSPNEAWCLADPGRTWAVFFPNGGTVSLDVSETAHSELSARWMRIRESIWLDPFPLAVDRGRVYLTTPEPEGCWAILVIAGDHQCDAGDSGTSRCGQGAVNQVRGPA